MNEAMKPAAALEQFTRIFAPRDVVPVGRAFADYAGQKLPRTLVDLYTQHGIGWYGEQQFKLVDPREWMPVLQTWLGGGVESIPFGLTSFGHVYHVDASGRVQVLDPHFLTNNVVADDSDTFFGEHLISPQSHLNDLRGPHGGARNKLGELGEGEIYFFTPMLPLGGTVSLDSLDKGNGVQHLLMTHQMVREHRGL